MPRIVNATLPELPRTALSLGPCDSFTELAGRYLQEYSEKISACLQRLSEEQIWWRPDASRANSVGNLVLHLEGNLTAWILDGLAGEAHARHRAAEFTRRGDEGREALAQRLTAVVTRCRAILDDVDDAELTAARSQQGYASNGLGIVFHAVEHMAYHTGQIVWVTKQLNDPGTPAATQLEFYPQHKDE